MKEENNLFTPEDRKAKKIFILICIIAAFCGAVLSILFQVIKYYAVNPSQGLCRMSPYICLFVAVCSCIACMVFFNQGKSLYNQTKEDEEKISKCEWKFDTCIAIASLSIIPTYLFFALGLSSGQSTDNTVSFIRIYVLCLVSLLLSLVSTIYYQRKAINFLKIINPEKKGSIYDLNFDKKWLDSCDEAQKLQIYKGGYKSFLFTKYTCLVAWLISFLFVLFTGEGVLAVILISVIWFASTLGYVIETHKVIM